MNVESVETRSETVDWSIQLKWDNQKRKHTSSNLFQVEVVESILTVVRKYGWDGLFQWNLSKEKGKYVGMSLLELLHSLDRNRQHRRLLQEDRLFSIWRELHDHEELKRYEEVWDNQCIINVLTLHFLWYCNREKSGDKKSLHSEMNENRDVSNRGWKHPKEIGMRVKIGKWWGMKISGNERWANHFIRVRRKPLS